MVLFVVCTLHLLVGQWLQFTLAEVKPQPITTYQFLRQDCQNGAFKPSQSSDLLGNLVSTSGPTDCLDSDGTGPDFKLKSANTVANELKLFKGNTITIEMWIQPTRNISSSSSILSFGKDMTTSSACTNNMVVKQAPNLVNPATTTGNIKHEVLPICLDKHKTLIVTMHLYSVSSCCL